jgi:hypothetical protein
MRGFGLAVIYCFRYGNNAVYFKEGRTCKKFCVNGYTTGRRKYGLFKRSTG